MYNLLFKLILLVEKHKDAFINAVILGMSVILTIMFFISIGVFTSFLKVWVNS